MGDHGGKAPPKKSGGEKKSGGGFWSFLGDVLGNVSINVSSGQAGGRGASSRNPTDPQERMEPVKAERKEAYEEAIYRKTQGGAGTAPAVRVDRDRQMIARSLDARRSAPAQPKVPQGAGAPLSAEVRGKMEPRLGGDLSDVRVHTTGESAAAAEGLSAKAFTVGNDVHFGSGEYQPGTKQGDKLLAHELTHVVQGQKSGVQRKADDAAGGDEKDAGVSDPSEPAEKEADAVGDQVADHLHGPKGDDGNAVAAPGAKPTTAAAKPAQISAKLVHRKIFRTWIDKAALPGPQKAPTIDTNHPHLVELGIKDLGPYRYLPMQGTFEYKLPAALADVWKDALATTDYVPEKPPKPQAGVTPADQAARIVKAKQKIPGIDAILAVNGGATPRTFTGVQQEDTIGTADDAHNVQRHCISGASDMKSRDDVALRAAFGMIGGTVQGAYNTTASAFGSVADANASVGPPLNAHMTSQWSTLKFNLAAGKGPGSVPLAGGAQGAVIFRSADGAQLPEIEVPKYLGLKPGHEGVRPLYAGDARWQTWWNGNPPERKKWEAKHGVGNVPPPLTTDASASATGISARVIATQASGSGGWVLHASWPSS